MLSRHGVDGNETGKRIVVGDWTSAQDEPLCTTAACSLPHDLLTPGQYTVALRVQDDEGVWSAAEKA